MGINKVCTLSWMGQGEGILEIIYIPIIFPPQNSAELILGQCLSKWQKDQ